MVTPISVTRIWQPPVALCVVVVSETFSSQLLDWDLPHLLSIPVTGVVS
jgi:hypothetical protein